MHPALKVAAVIAALVIGFFANDLRQLASSSTSTSSIDDYCFISTEPCLQDGVTMSLDTDTVQPLVPTTFTVKWSNPQTKTLVLDLEGLEMDMGTVKYVLNANEENLFQVDILLPVCTTEKMTWVGSLTDGDHSVSPALRMER
ncbi:hypothetical protein [Vibrio genomosp. F10]|uniref:Copper-binding protein n=2 Tax=Vibrio genomosp. F10 TaxID=723171 RepID=A0A1B9QSV1_9VIBR|nr:hypothetical protein [Vibrio genomosp. F10]OCH68896.1 hypothetical protein A6E14_16455 [Vibrio genomosp. F10]OEE32163.1 hypothetical protein A1QO_11750 [Vibrio genomosp. F10 str. ZF-129]OEE94293.1 hypothetical protein A1QM_07055 [Vibrio genomosp. F10 str. 9ZC157]OEF04784.1 hypothetical protein A1QI_10025 [Vibrio genomosp. F10 str. 9ZB36]OEF05538.1 hypothetical protein A1QK_09195 [Vibrio genomosp. F10 str. 9ZD137]